MQGSLPTPNPSSNGCAGLGTQINIPVSQATMAEWAKEKPVGERMQGWGWPDSSHGTAPFKSSKSVPSPTPRTAGRSGSLSGSRAAAGLRIVLLRCRRGTVLHCTLGRGAASPLTLSIPVTLSCPPPPLPSPSAGWSLFYDDNDQPLPQPLAGAALQAKQRELQQKTAAEGKGKPDGKAAAAPAQGGDGPAAAAAAVAGSKRAAAGKQQAGKAAAAASSSKSTAAEAGKQPAKGAAPSPPGPPPAAGTAGTAGTARSAAPAASSCQSASPAAAPAAAELGIPEAAAAQAAAGQPAASPLATAAGLPPPTSSRPAKQPVSQSGAGHPAGLPGSASSGQLQPAIVINQVAPVQVTSQRFLPAGPQLLAAAGGDGRTQPKPPAALKPPTAPLPKPGSQRPRAPKRARQEDSGGGEPALAAASIAANGRAQRTQRARRPALRTLEAVSGSDFSLSKDEEASAARRARRSSGARQRGRQQQRGLDSSLIAALAAAEAAERAAAPRRSGGASQLDPVATGTPAAAAAAAELGTPTGASAAGTPLSPGRPPHRSRKTAAHPAAEAFAFSPFMEIEVPAPLQDSGEAEEEE